MKIKNVVFDAGGVLLEWDPPGVVAKLYPDLEVQAQIRKQIFEHPDWHEYDRGALSEEAASKHFAKLSGRTPAEVLALLRATCASLTPMPASIKLMEELAAANVDLFLLSNMPVSTYEFLLRRDAFFVLFKKRMISGAILKLKPDPAIYKHLIDKTGIVPSESVFIDDLQRNVDAARECGLHAIQFRGIDACRVELRTYLPNLNL